MQLKKLSLSTNPLIDAKSNLTPNFFNPKLGTVIGALGGMIANMYHHSHILGGKFSPKIAAECAKNVSDCGVVFHTIRNNSILNFLSNKSQAVITNCGLVLPFLAPIIELALRTKELNSAKKMEVDSQINNDNIITLTEKLDCAKKNLVKTGIAVTITALFLQTLPLLISKATFDPSGHIMAKMVFLNSLDSIPLDSSNKRKQWLINAAVVSNSIPDLILMGNTAATYHSPTEMIAGASLACSIQFIAKKITTYCLGNSKPANLKN